MGVGVVDYILQTTTLRNIANPDDFVPVQMKMENRCRCFRTLQCVLVMDADLHRTQNIVHSTLWIYIFRGAVYTVQCTYVASGYRVQLSYIHRIQLLK